MSLLSHIKELSFSAAWHWTKVLLAKPLRIWPTYRATTKALKMSQKHYPGQHSRWAGNAFKHALWNMLIAQATIKKGNSEEALQWAKNVTDAHEYIVRNDEPNHRMDVHNNEVGRKLFLLALANNQTSVDELVALAKQKADEAQYITQINHFNNYPYDLVYIR